MYRSRFAACALWSTFGMFLVIVIWQYLKAPNDRTGTVIQMAGYSIEVPIGWRKEIQVPDNGVLLTEPNHRATITINEYRFKNKSEKNAFLKVAGQYHLSLRAIGTHATVWPAEHIASGIQIYKIAYLNLVKTRWTRNYVTWIVPENENLVLDVFIVIRDGEQRKLSPIANRFLDRIELNIGVLEPSASLPRKVRPFGNSKSNRNIFEDKQP